MSSREMFDLEPGDTGEALLPAPHSDRDASEAPPANKVNGRGALLTLAVPQALDLDAIIEEWLQQCGACDFGMYGCSCPTGDYRPTMSRLVDEIERLRALVEP